MADDSLDIAKLKRDLFEGTDERVEQSVDFDEEGSVGSLMPRTKQLPEDSLEISKSRTKRSKHALEDPGDNDEDNTDNESMDEDGGTHDGPYMPSLRYSSPQRQHDQGATQSTQDPTAQELGEVQVKATQSLQQPTQTEQGVQSSLENDTDDGQSIPDTQRIISTQTQQNAPSTQLVASESAEDSTQIISVQPVSPSLEHVANNIHLTDVGELFLTTPGKSSITTPATSKTYVPLAQSQERRRWIQEQENNAESNFDREFRPGPVGLNPSRRRMEWLEPHVPGRDEFLNVVLDGEMQVQSSPELQVPRSEARGHRNGRIRELGTRRNDDIVIRDSEDEGSPIMMTATTAIISTSPYAKSQEVIQVPSSEPPIQRHLVALSHESDLETGEMMDAENLLYEMEATSRKRGRKRSHTDEGRGMARSASRARTTVSETPSSPSHSTVSSSAPVGISNWKRQATKRTLKMSESPNAMQNKSPTALQGIQEERSGEIQNGLGSEGDTTATHANTWFALWPGPPRPGYYPCVIDHEATPQNGQLPVIFANDTAGLAKPENTYVFDIRVGDVVKVDLSGMRSFPYEVVGFEKRGGLMITSKSGDDMVRVRIAATKEEHLIELGQIYVPKALWPTFKENKNLEPASGHIHRRVCSGVSDGERTGSPALHYALSPVKGNIPFVHESLPSGIVKGISKTRGIFSDFAFALSGYNPKERAELETIITSNGGWYLTNGLCDLFDVGTDGSNGGMKLLPKEREMSRLHFAGVITQTVTRTAKVLEAAALGFPCLTKEFLMKSDLDGFVAKRTRYTVRNAGNAFDCGIRDLSSLWEIYAERSKPLLGQRVIFVRKAEMDDSSLIRPILLMGPDAMAFTTDTKSIEDIAKSGPPPASTFVLGSTMKKTGVTYTTMGETASSSERTQSPRSNWDIVCLDASARKSMPVLQPGVQVVDKDWFWKLLGV